MEKTLCTCGRCKKPIKSGDTSATVTVQYHEPGGSVGRPLFVGIYFCDACAEKIISQICEDDPKPKKESKPKRRYVKSTTQPPGVDRGKVLALYRTGRWMIKEIADECRCSHQRVSQIIADAREKGEL